MKLLKVTTLVSTLGLLLLIPLATPNNNPVDNVIVDSNDSIQSDTIEQTTDTIEISTEPVDETVREPIEVYLNPSVQIHNLYVDGLGNEAENMCEIANLMYDKLQTINYINVSGNLNKNGLSLSQSVKESNSIDRDIHFALHSNAGGGEGTEIYTKTSQTFSSYMYEGFLELGQFKRRGIKDGSHLYEVNNSKATHVALIELAFHDNSREAKFIVDNKERIADKLCESLLKFINDTYL